MRKFTSILLLWVGMHAQAATTITTPTVSGHWTVSGAPYDVYNDIQVASGQALAIDPGVNVVFHGPYKLAVSGILSAVGTITAPITFQVYDTTGFTTDNTTTAGGWHGIHFLAYSGTVSDSSSLQYCNITNTKFDSVDYYAGDVRTLYIERKLTVSNCNFYSNKSNPSSAVDLIRMHPATGVLIEFGKCNFYNNNCGHFLFISFFDSTYIHDCNIYQNTCGINAINQESGGFTFINNDVYGNSELGSTGGEGILTVNSNATIKGNKIHDNICQQDAAIFCGGGFVNIISNLICNNQHVSGLCGIVDGGGALNLSYNYSGATHASTYYNVKNNVLANNYSSFQGGAIKIFNADATITNNQIINNSSVSASAIYINDGDSSSYIIKNNIFMGNVQGTLASVNSPVVLGFINHGNLEYEYNWQEAPTALELSISGTGFTTSGDSTKNIIGTDPGMIAPTPNSFISTSALTANFDLKPTSTCIDKGDTVGITVEPLDYAGNGRIFNSRVDIGAYEYYPAALNAGSVVATAPSIAVFPNPAVSTFSVSTTAGGIFSVYNMEGRKIGEHILKSGINSISLPAGTPAGIYIGRFMDENARLSTVRIVTQ